MYYKAKEMLHKARQEKHGNHSSILARWNNDYKYIKFLSDVGRTEEHTMLHGRNALVNHTSRWKQREFGIRHIGFSHWMKMKGFSNHYINDVTLLKRKDNARDCTTNTWQRLNKITEPFLAVNKQDSEKDKRLRELKNMTMQSTLAQAVGSTKSRGETCRQRRPRLQPGIETIGRRAVVIPSILRGLTIREFSSKLEPVSVAWRKNFQTTDGECQQNTHSNSMYSTLQRTLS